MLALDLIIKGIEYVIVGYFLMSGMYILIFSIAGNFYRKRQAPVKKYQHKIAVLIPAYKEDAVIVEVAKSALAQNYPSHLFDVIVIADSLESDTIAELKTLPIHLLEVFFKKSTKSKALNRAMNRLNENYGGALILDADNIMEVDFLQKINDAFNSGYHIVQGHRKAKNLNTPFAVLDAASEEINNHIYRKGHRALGLSSGLIGSGMAFNYPMFKAMMASVSAIGGFDKELEFKFAKDTIEIEYLHDAVVLDEKIQKPSDFSKQRRRWLSTQYVYFKKYCATGFYELFFNRNINFFDKLLQMILPPRILLIGIAFILTCLYCLLFFVFNISANVSVYLWIFNLSITVTAFVLALPKSFYNTSTLRALFSLPLAFVQMGLLLFKLKGANKKFIHTTHGSINN